MPCYFTPRHGCFVAAARGVLIDSLNRTYIDRHRINLFILIEIITSTLLLTNISGDQSVFQTSRLATVIEVVILTSLVSSAVIFISIAQVGSNADLNTVFLIVSFIDIIFQVENKLDDDWNCKIPCDPVLFILIITSGSILVFGILTMCLAYFKCYTKCCCSKQKYLQFQNPQQSAGSFI